MTTYSKRYVNLWVKEDKHKNPMLSGKDKTSGNYFYVFSDKENPSIKRLAMGTSEGSIVTVGELTTGESDYGTYWKYKNYFIADNRFYTEDDPFLKNRDGEYIMNKDGEKIPQPEYTLSISKADEEQ